MSIPTIALFASGSGSNAEAIISYFRQEQLPASFLIISNKQQAGVFERAERLKVESNYFAPADLKQGEEVAEFLKARNCKLIVLAGYLLLVPPPLLALCPVINLHPALLPKYGGRGMYGMNVHKAVLAAGETESGITIHYANNQYDEGSPLLQTSCPILPDDTPEQLQQRVQQLEHRYFPLVVADLYGSLLEE